MASNTFVVKESFVGDLGNGDILFREGEPIDGSSKAVKKWPHMFRAQPSRLDEATIEQATAAPGEKRSIGLRRGGKVAAPKAEAPKTTAAEEAKVEAEAAAKPSTGGKAMTTSDLSPEDDDGAA